MLAFNMLQQYFSQKQEAVPIVENIRGAAGEAGAGVAGDGGEQVQVNRLDKIGLLFEPMMQPGNALQALKNEPARKAKHASAIATVRKHNKMLSSRHSSSSRASTGFDRQIREYISGNRFRMGKLSGVKELDEDEDDSEDLVDNSSHDEDSNSPRSRGLTTISAGMMAPPQPLKAGDQSPL